MTDTQSFEIAGRRIGAGAPPYVIAEIGNNHGGDVAAAKTLIDAAHGAGADGLKLQIFRAAKFLARSSAYYERFVGYELSRVDIAALFEHARGIGAVLFSSVFDAESADILEDCGAPAYKIASGDVTHLPLLRHVAGFGKPIVLSTGGATLAEVETAVETIRQARSDTPLAILHCVSQYPADPNDANLACMAGLRARFACPTGYSDHSQGIAVCIAAAALGAEVIEKHFTLDKTLPGPDHKLSADPQDMAALVAGCRAAQVAVGRAEKAPVEPADFIPLIRRSPTAQVAIPKGTRITPEMIEIKRPGTGLAPADLDRVIGARAARDIAEDETLAWDMVETA
jgi:N,N'-diacetyllegionaminate synthase